jgi:hypothetical protein
MRLGMVVEISGRPVMMLGANMLCLASMGAVVEPVAAVVTALARPF